MYENLSSTIISMVERNPKKKMHSFLNYQNTAYNGTAIVTVLEVKLTLNVFNILFKW